MNTIDTLVTVVLLVTCLHLFIDVIVAPMKRQQLMKMLTMLMMTCRMTGVSREHRAGHHQAEQLVEATDKDSVQLE